MWSPQQYFKMGKEKGCSNEKLEEYSQQIKLVSWHGNDLPSLLSLKHLAVRVELEYSYLREIVTRSRIASYKHVIFEKRSGSMRNIHIPETRLMHVQRWINVHILQKIATHTASYAFSKSSSIKKCAIRHTGAQWLIKMDITDFFESISEIQVYRVFRRLGYKPLVAFELARICTIESIEHNKRSNPKAWKVREGNSKIPDYTSKTESLGHLPQGAPTSPMLSNLVMKDIDEQLGELSKKWGLTYTRYSDDLAFSKRTKSFSREKAKTFIKEVSKILLKSGFQPHGRKTKIIPPGSRKIVLGLLVDHNFPKLRKEFKDNIRQHLYYIKKFDNNPRHHASHRRFQTIFGLKNHLEGLIIFARSIDKNYGEKMKKEFDSINWP